MSSELSTRLSATSSSIPAHELFTLESVLSSDPKAAAQQRLSYQRHVLTVSNALTFVEWLRARTSVLKDTKVSPDLCLASDESFAQVQGPSPNLRPILRWLT